MRRLMLGIAAICSAAPAMARAQVETFRNDYTGFVNAVGPLSSIDFETLPDGTPSAGHAGTLITSTFNYDAYGAHFSSPIDTPYIAGNSTTGFDLRTLVNNFQRTWLDINLSTPLPAAGIFFPGGTTLYAYDSAGL